MRSYHQLCAALLALLIPNVLAAFEQKFEGGSFKVTDDIESLPAGPVYKSAPVYVRQTKKTNKRWWKVEERDDDGVPEELYVLFCTEAGFRGTCGVFGSPPGGCVDFYLYNSAGKHDVSSIFDDKTDSLSTNTGGFCTFYNHRNCDRYDNDTSITLGYAYDLSSKDPIGYKGVGPYGGDVKDKISSWKC